MGLDVKYRPKRYADVLGQEATIEVCKNYVRSGRGFQQSYVFCGPFGTGKTTLGRILARALLCKDPQDGEPCDECRSCKQMLAGTCDLFVEVDAATNSGKENIRTILDQVQYGSFSGHRRIYLFDESHELSRQAMDSMLKPLEDTVAGTLDKQLVCIFCTTEPDKMRQAILSRCAQAFQIQLNSPEKIAERLAWVCGQESLEFEEEALKIIAEVKEGHVRDCLKAVETLSLQGKITTDLVRTSLHLAAHGLAQEVLVSLEDEPAVVEAVGKLQETISPAAAYERLAETALLAFKLHLVPKLRVPSYLDRDALQKLGAQHKEFLLVVAERLAERPYRATYTMLLCDLLTLSLQKKGVYPVAGLQLVSSTPQEEQLPQELSKLGDVQEDEPLTSSTGIYISPVARRDRLVKPVDADSSVGEKNVTDTVSVELFRQVFMQIRNELRGHNESGGSSRQPNMGVSGTDLVRGETD